MLQTVEEIFPYVLLHCVTYYLIIALFYDEISNVNVINITAYFVQ